MITFVDKYRFLRALNRDAKLGKGARAVAFELMEFCKKDGSEHPFGSRRHLAQLTGLSGSVIDTGVRELLARGWFKKPKDDEVDPKASPKEKADKRGRKADRFEPIWSRAKAVENQGRVARKLASSGTDSMPLSGPDSSAESTEENPYKRVQTRAYARDGQADVVQERLLKRVKALYCGVGQQALLEVEIDAFPATLWRELSAWNATPGADAKAAYKLIDSWRSSQAQDDKPAETERDQRRRQRLAQDIAARGPNRSAVGRTFDDDLEEERIWLEEMAEKRRNNPPPAPKVDPVDEYLEALERGDLPVVEPAAKRQASEDVHFDIDAWHRGQIACRLRATYERSGLEPPTEAELEALPTHVWRELRLWNLTPTFELDVRLEAARRIIDQAAADKAA